MFTNSGSESKDAFLDAMDALASLLSEPEFVNISNSPGIDSKESILPAYVAWRVGMSSRVVVPARQVGNRFLGSLKGLQIRALFSTVLCTF